MQIFFLSKDKKLFDNISSQVNKRIIFLNNLNSFNQFSLKSTDVLIFDEISHQEFSDLYHQKNLINDFLSIIFINISFEADKILKGFNGNYWSFKFPQDQNKITKFLINHRDSNLKKEIYFEKLPSVHTNSDMKKAYQSLDLLRDKDLSVLIFGESGVGKEVYAKALHYSSVRSNNPYVGINCASIPGSLLESELFGAEKGSYTGADILKKGKFEHSNTGTLLLDEISEMDIKLQAKLLRVIQEKELYRIGGKEKITLDVRLISTTNRNMKEWVANGSFRGDLFYRLNVMSVYLPPLRERPEDSVYLTEEFVREFNQKNPDQQLELTPKAINQIRAYHWPGNIRELKNIILRTCYLSNDGKIKKIFFDDWAHQSEQNVSFAGTIKEMEKLMILKALKSNNGNQLKASGQLGITSRTLRNKLRQYEKESLDYPEDIN